MRIHRALPLAAAAAALLIAAPAAMAVQTTVRVEASGFTAVPATTVDEPSAGGTYADTAGHSGTTTQATAFGATAIATNAAGTTWGFTWGSMGAYVNTFAGQGMDPTTYANWWDFTVNGYSAPVGSSGLQSVAGDSYLWFQNPDATFSLGSYALVATPNATALLPGQPLTVAVKGDDLSKVDSQADATRFGITNPANIQTPAGFPAISGAVVHVGSQAYAASGSDYTINNLPAGTWWVWVTKDTDASYVYAPSARFQVNVGDAPAITGASTSPKKYARNKALTFRFTSSKDLASFTYTVKTAKGKVIGKATTGQLSAGAQSVVWAGTNVPKNLGKKLSVSLKGADQWGRTSKVVKFQVAVK